MLLRHQVTQEWARDHGFHNTDNNNDLNKSYLKRAEKTEAQLRGQGMKRKRRSVGKKTDSLQVVLLGRGVKKWETVERDMGKRHQQLKTSMRRIPWI